MARVAVVTGGTRGIGRAISIGLKNAGYNVAANYGGNDKAAQEFHNETGIPVGRLGKAEDIARTVLFLVADDADFITGSTLSVNGGQHMY